jgi:hypothetical protein
MMNTPSFQEDHISQVPALQLLQNLGYTYLRPQEVTLQNWACSRRLAGLVVPRNAERTLSACETALDRAEDIYARIGATGLTLRERSNQEHIQFIREELAVFRSLAEL